MRDNLHGEKDILVAFIYGSYAQNRETISSDIDLFVVGEIPSKDLHKLIRKAQGISGREINYALYTPEEFTRKVQTKDHFISEVLDSAKIFIKGSESDLQKIAR
ncbi:MAG: nucleotidyltransferase domain-containing protein [Actinomycetota bacterium]|nr:nucleotidyltransferase domain-containing protein [Actinomycetota bacterium]MDI6821656.1 nucleotidyltransferase domain-containing protein [Actinomycetota bacterium]